MTHRYFDSLVHVTPDGRWFDTPFDASERRLREEMDAAGIERAIVVALAGYIPNRFVVDVCRQSRGTLIPAAGFDPSASRTPGEAAARGRSELRDEGFSIVKLHPRLNRYDPLDPRVLAFLDELASWKTPPAIWIDSLIYPRGVRLSLPIAHTIRHLAERYGGLTFVCLHAGGAAALELFDAIRACPNVYLDLSYSLVQYARSTVAVDHRFLLERFDRRTVFGSDFPEVGLPEATGRFEALAEGLDTVHAENVRSRTLDQLLNRVLAHQG